MIFHSLTAVRAIAEFFVVHYHFGGFYRSESSVEGAFYVQDLMSLFFVLSGFVAMHTNKQTGFDARIYWCKRFSKTYPSYVVFLILDLLGNRLGMHGRQFRCAGLEYLIFASQLVSVSPWLGSQHIFIVNEVSWYMATLFWLWLFFPVLHGPLTLTCRAINPWGVILLTYLLSLLACTLAAPLYYHHSRSLPILRVFEFVMGACTALATDRKSHLLALATTVAIMISFWIFTSTRDTLPLENSLCELWPKNQLWHISADIYLSKSAIVWVLMIHWLAHEETTNPHSLVISTLTSDLFRWLGSFSLPLYLGHYVVACGLHSFPSLWGYNKFWTKDFHMIACYLLCYAYSRTVQRLLDGYCVPKENFIPDETLELVSLESDDIIPCD